MMAPPRCWAELWRYWLAMPPVQSHALWDALPPALLVATLEAAVACGALPRSEATRLEEALFAGVGRDGAWL